MTAKLLVLAALAIPSVARADDRCTIKVHAKIKLEGSFAHDRGCISKTITVDGARYADFTAAAPRGLAVLGWDRANEAKRVEIAETWIDQVLAPTQGFRRVDSASFSEFHPRQHKLDNGGLELSFWTDVTVIGMLQPTERRYEELIVTIDRARMVRVHAAKTHVEPF